MVNTNIQGPIPITGRGMVIRPNGHFEPGEFKRLVDCEILDNKIVRRRNMRQGYNEVLPGANTPRFIGQTEEGLIFSSYNEDDTDNSHMALFFRDNGGDPQDLESSELFSNYYNSILTIGAFFYNNRNYWLGVKTTSGVVTFNLRSTPDSYYPDDSAFGGLSLDSEDLFAFTPDNDYNLNVGKVAYNNSFIFKDRYWICLSGGLWFSKATDPTEFGVDDGGGFFLFPDDEVTYAVAVKDALYVICKTKIYVITYQDDPNSDASQRVISSDVGGEHACIFRDTPFFSNAEGIWEIQNLYVNKVIDSKDYGFDPVEGMKAEITPFGEYLYINMIREMIDESLLDYRINHFRSGYITGGWDTTDWDNAGGDAVVTLEAASFSWPDIGSTHSAKVTCVTPSTAMGFVTEDESAGDYFLEVDPETTMTMGFKAKTNVIADCFFEVQVNYYDAANAPVGSSGGIALGPNDFDSASGWQQFTFNLRYDIDAPTTHHASIRIRLKREDASAIDTGEAFWIQDLVVEKDGYNEVFEFGKALTAVTNTAVLNTNSLGSVVIFNKSLFTNPELVNRFFSPSTSSSHEGFQTWVFNADNGSMHAIKLPPAFSGSFDNEFIMDLAVKYDSEVTATPMLVISRCNEQNERGWNVYYMALNRNLDDNVWDLKSATHYSHPQIDVEVSNFVPDGLEYAMKRFRNLEIQGIYPRDNFKIATSVDNDEIPTGLATAISDIVGFDSAHTRPHYPHRMGINSRGHAINVKLFAFPYTAAFPEGDEDADPMWGEFEVSDMRLLWAYTGRGPIRNTFNQAP